MSLIQLKGAVADLLDDLETRGDIDDLSYADMDGMFGTTATIIGILERDQDMGHLVLGRELQHTILILKTMAVTLHKAKPLKERIEDVTGMLDWYECVDIVSDLNNSLDEELEESA